MSRHPDPFPRHHLAWLTARGWSEAAAAVPAVQQHVVRRWQARDWPAIIRRRDADVAADQVCLGIALPPDAEGIKLRLALRVPAADIREVRAPLPIADVMAHAAAPWREALAELEKKALAQGLDIRVYGSLALQALTGLAYLRATSDIDLLFSPTDRHQLQRGMVLLTAYAQRLPIDGEVAFPDGAAVAWKEWWQASQLADGDGMNNRVLAKRSDDVALLSVTQLLDSLATSTIAQGNAA